LSYVIAKHSVLNLRILAYFLILNKLSACFDKNSKINKGNGSDVIVETV
jgi:hypothetical protein